MFIGHPSTCMVCKWLFLKCMFNTIWTLLDIIRFDVYYCLWLQKVFPVILNSLFPYNHQPTIMCSLSPPILIFWWLKSRSSTMTHWPIINHLDDHPAKELVSKNVGPSNHQPVWFLRMTMVWRYAKHWIGSNCSAWMSPCSPSTFVCAP